MRNLLFTIMIILMSWSCQQDQNDTSSNLPLFSTVNADFSGLSFSNNIIESDTLNYYNFPYLYMGGGVAVGDINNDGLSDIFLTGNMVENKLYLNKGNFKFEDISQMAGVSGDQRWYTGVTMVDINNDGWLDIYLCVSGRNKPFANQLYINNKDNTFSEKAKEFGIADESSSIQSTFFDYDKDGDLDLFVANYPQVPVSMGNRFYNELMKKNELKHSGHLYENNDDGTFTDITEQAGLQKFGLTLGLVSSDFNNDGFIDLYLSNDFNVPDYFYLNNGDGTFSEKVKEATRHTAMFGMGIDAADFNNDGLIDLAQVDMTPADHKRAKINMASMSPSTFWEAVELGFHYQYMQNCIQLNNGIKEGLPIFSDVSRMTGMATTDWSWGVQMADFDNDGWKDFFITNGLKRDVNNNDAIQAFKSSTFFQNKRGDYAKLPSVPISNYAFKNNGDLSFLNTSKAWGIDAAGFSNGFAYGDLDNDGDIDLVVNNLDAEVSLFQNQLEVEKNRFLQIKLNGSAQNPFGIGAKIMLQNGDTTQVQEMNLTKGFQSSVAPILYFGIGKKKMLNSCK